MKAKDSPRLGSRAHIIYSLFEPFFLPVFDYSQVIFEGHGIVRSNGLVPDSPVRHITLILYLVVFEACKGMFVAKPTDDAHANLNGAHTEGRARLENKLFFFGDWMHQKLRIDRPVDRLEQVVISSKTSGFRFTFGDRFMVSDNGFAADAIDDEVGMDRAGLFLRQHWIYDWEQCVNSLTVPAILPSIFIFWPSSTGT